MTDYKPQNPLLCKLGTDAGLLNYIEHETPREYFMSAFATEEDVFAFAETIMTSTLYINEQVSENNLYVLVNSGFGSLERAAFFMLTHLYQNHIPTVLFAKDEEKEMQQL